jgi:hypothetical protein
MGSTSGVCEAIFHAIAAGERWAAVDRNKPRGVLSFSVCERFRRVGWNFNSPLWCCLLGTGPCMRDCPWGSRSGGLALRGGAL